MESDNQRSDFEELDLGNDPLQALEKITSQIGSQNQPEVEVASDDIESTPEPSWGSLARDDAPFPQNPDVFASGERADNLSQKLQEAMSEPPAPAEESSGGALSRLAEGMREGRSISKEEKRVEKEAQALSIDTSSRPKNRLQAALGKLSDSPVKQMPLDADPPSAFEQLLVPLRPAEVDTVRQEILETPTLFSRLEETRKAAGRRQRFGVVAALAVITMFFLLVAPDYLSEVLPNITRPDWVPEAIPTETVGKILFALGLLAPICAVFVFSESIRLLLGAAADQDGFDFTLGLSAMVLGVLSLVAMASGNIVWALLFLALYAIADKIIEAIRDRWKI